jgi:hypothetical protein
MVLKWNGLLADVLWSKTELCASFSLLDAVEDQASATRLVLKQAHAS